MELGLKIVGFILALPFVFLFAYLSLLKLADVDEGQNRGEMVALILSILFVIGIGIIYFA